MEPEFRLVGQAEPQPRLSWRRIRKGLWGLGAVSIAAGTGLYLVAGGILGCLLVSTGAVTMLLGYEPEKKEAPGLSAGASDLRDDRPGGRQVS